LLASVSESWNELVEILIGDEGSVDRERLKVESARLRKRYQLVKERMRKLLEEKV
jgi:hypothetical protein